MASNSLSLATLTARFGTDEKTLIEALWRSPNARGYLLGSLSEILVSGELKRLGFELERIKEKWNGPKLHHGDYYVRRPGGRWYVLESKGLKSNSEKWHRIREAPTEPRELERWFARRHGEIGNWWNSLSAARKAAIVASQRFNRAKVLETHFVSGTGGRAGRTIATPRKEEFHVVALDLFLRTGKHEFIYASSDALEAAEQDPAHLKQNYLIDIMTPTVDREPTLAAPWTRDFVTVFKSLRHPVIEADRQVDTRAPGARAPGVEGEEE
ncbi:MAG: hypothetical protein ACREA0_10305 [bacterium]